MKVRITANQVLGLCALLLFVLCALSICSPVRFRRESAKREEIVKKRLLQIRQAAEKYRQQNGLYTGSFDVLTGEGYLVDSLRYIPFSHQKVFELSATVQTGKNGRQIPLMQCAAPYHDFLSGMDEGSIVNLVEQANASGNYPGLKIGDLETPNNNAGNWE